MAPSRATLVLLLLPLVLLFAAASKDDTRHLAAADTNVLAPDPHTAHQNNPNLGMRYFRGPNHHMIGPVRSEKLQLFNRRVCQERVIYVNKDESGHFTSIQGAIELLQRRNKCRVNIVIGAGVFREKVTIKRSRPHVTLIGHPTRQTIIVWNDTASSRDRSGRRLRTFNSATVTVNSNYFIAHNLTFMNTASAQRRGAKGQQAVALRISGDKAAFYRCNFYGHQDTLYDHRGQHYFKDCFITGTVDFIFGNGKSLYEEARVVVRDDHYGVPGTITAQRRNQTTPDTGFVLVNSRVTGAGKAYLGRAWGKASRVVFANTFLDNIVVPEGWGNWGVPEREKTVFYAQFNWSGCVASGALVAESLCCGSSSVFDNTIHQWPEVAGTGIRISDPSVLTSMTNRNNLTSICNR